MEAAAPINTTTRKTAVVVPIHSNWLQLIRYCGAYHQAGSLALKVENGIPVKRVQIGTKKDIRFKAMPLVDLRFVREGPDIVTCRITAKWANLIDFTKTRLPYGQLCVKFSAGEPDKLVEPYCRHDINFGHPESFPQVFEVFNEYQQ